MSSTYFVFSLLANDIFFKNQKTGLRLDLEGGVCCKCFSMKIPLVSIEKCGQGIVSSLKKIETQLQNSYKILSQKQLKAFFQYSSVIVRKLFDQF